MLLPSRCRYLKLHFPRGVLEVYSVVHTIRDLSQQWGCAAVDSVSRPVTTFSGLPCLLPLAGARQGGYAVDGRPMRCLATHAGRPAATPIAPG
jgi:hypothetical protein